VNRREKRSKRWSRFSFKTSARLGVSLRGSDRAGKSCVTAKHQEAPLG